MIPPHALVIGRVSAANHCVDLPTWALTDGNVPCSTGIISYAHCSDRPITETYYRHRPYSSIRMRTAKLRRVVLCSATYVDCQHGTARIRSPLLQQSISPARRTHSSKPAAAALAPAAVDRYLLPAPGLWQYDSR